MISLFYFINMIRFGLKANVKIDCIQISIWIADKMDNPIILTQYRN
jgi:hypothetical protein